MTAQPRFIRLKNAPAYLGMCKGVFYQDMKPYLVEIPIGKKGIAYDRLDLDALADQYKEARGRSPIKRRPKWQEEEQVGSISVVIPGTSKRSTVDTVFAEAAERARGKKPRQNSQKNVRKSA